MNNRARTSNKRRRRRGESGEERKEGIPVVDEDFCRGVKAD